MSSFLHTQYFIVLTSFMDTNMTGMLWVPSAIAWRWFHGLHAVDVWWSHILDRPDNIGNSFCPNVCTSPGWWGGGAGCCKCWCCWEAVDLLGVLWSKSWAYIAVCLHVTFCWSWTASCAFPVYTVLGLVIHCKQLTDRWMVWWGAKKDTQGDAQCKVHDCIPCLIGDCQFLLAGWWGGCGGENLQISWEFHVWQYGYGLYVGLLMTHTLLHRIVRWHQELAFLRVVDGWLRAGHRYQNKNKKRIKK